VTRLCAPLDAPVAGPLLVLADRVAAATGCDPLDARVRRALETPGPGTLAVCVPAEGGTAGGAPIAALVVSAPVDERGNRVAGLLIDPALADGAPDGSGAQGDQPRRIGSRRDAAVAALTDRLLAGTGPVAAVTTLWGIGDDPARDRALTGAGWQVGRRQHRLEISLPVPPADPVPGVALRRYRPGIDDDAVLAVNNRAFAGHPDQGGWTRARLAAALVADPRFTPADLLVAVDADAGQPDGTCLGFCWTRLHPGSSSPPAGHPTPAPPAATVGEIHVIAVDPGAQGRGVGRLLVLAGLAHLHDRGAATGMLYVAADNEAALGLYRAVGFRRVRSDTAFLLSPSAGDRPQASATRVDGRREDA